MSLNLSQPTASRRHWAFGLWPLLPFTLVLAAAALLAWHYWPQLLMQSVVWQKALHQQMAGLLQQVKAAPQKLLEIRAENPLRLMKVAWHIGNRHTPAEIAAADLLSQAEHDADAQVLLVSTSRATIDYILSEVEVQVATLPREAIARASLNEARAILVRDLDAAAEVANLYGPEHLAIQIDDPEPLVDSIKAAGAVFVGRFAAETLGDYAAGPSHVLPTDGGARTLGGVTTASFMTTMSVQLVTEAGARQPAPIAARLARMEGLEAHARAADLRSEG